MRSWQMLCLSIIVIVASGTFPALAADITPAEQIQRLEAENASLRTEKAAVEQERDALKAHLAAEMSATNGKGNAAVVVAVRQALAKSQAAMDQADTTSRQIAAERDRALNALSQTRGALGACQEKNVKLIDVSRAVVAEYDKIDFFDAVFASDPVIGAKRIEVENFAQDSSDKIDAATFAPPTALPVPQNPAPETPQTTASAK